ncbi:Hypothetical predicted protein, partial [Paramuricea clavata]
MLLHVLLLSACLIGSTFSRNLPEGSADLVEKLGLKDQTKGVKKVNKFCHDAAYELDDKARLMMDTSKVFPEGLNLRSFGIVMTVKMKKGNTGHIFTMYSESSTPVLAIQANPLRLEHKDGVLDLAVEDSITDEMWHTIAIAVTEGHVEVLVDCDSANYMRRGDFDNSTIITGGQILLGMRFSGNGFLGSVEEVTILPGKPGKAVSYCNDLTDCKAKVTKKNRGLEPVEVPPQPSTPNDIQRADVQAIPDTVVVVDGNTYY